MGRPICILHLSDLHFESGNADSKIVIAALLKDIEREIKSGTTIDLIVFSGDLVNAGALTATFDEANQNFIAKVTSAAQILADRFVICPGNHDIDRDIVKKESYVEAGLLAVLKSRTAINEFIDDNSKSNISAELPPPFHRLENFYKKIWAMRTGNALLCTPFAMAYSFPVLDQTVGIACFNSAWRTTGAPDDADQGNLIIGERVVDQAADALEKSDIRIAVFHHPISWLHDPDQAAVESRLSAKFDILMFGHVHRAAPEYKKTISGEVVLSQGACLYKSREFFNGYNILKLDPVAASIEIAIMEYSDSRREFIPATRILENPILEFPLPTRGNRDPLTLTGMLLKVKPNIRGLANKHLSLVGGGGDQQLDIDTHFVCPGLEYGAGIQVRRKSNKTQEEQIAELLNDSKSAVVFGRPEAGKTSLAHYMAVQVSRGCADVPRLPLIASFADLRKGDRPLWRILRDYVNEISDNSILRVTLQNTPLLVFLDNVDVFDIGRITILKELIDQNKNIRWILLADSAPGGISLSSFMEEHLPDFNLYTLKDLSRHAIRTLSATWLQTGDDKDKADAQYRSVMEQIQRTGLPRNGYIVSLILWAIKHRSKGELLNEAVLLQNIIDFMLGRMDYTGALRSELDFTTKSAILQYLAMHFKNTTEIHEKNDVLNVIIALLNQKGLKYDAADLLNSFIDCGILDELGGRVSFRYRRFQDFFVAGQLRDSRELLNDILQNKYLDFSKELDLFTSRFRHESSLLEIGRGYVKAIALPEPKLKGETLQKYLESTRRADFSRGQLRQMRREPMTAEKVDELLDRAERRVAQKREIEKLEKGETGIDRSSVVVKYSQTLELYSRFVRNLEFVDKDQKVLHLKECFDAWEGVLRGIFSVIAEAISDIKKDIQQGTDETNSISNERLTKLIEFVESVMISYFPSFIAEAAYRALGSEKLSEFVEELSNNKSESPTFRLLCLFVLLELNAERTFELLRKFSEQEFAQDWMLTAITQRLFSFYNTRPLSKKLRQQFENLVIDLQTKLAGGRVDRGKAIADIRRLTFREEQDK